MKTIRTLATVKVLVAALFATCLFPAAANAQAAFQGKFRLQNEVRWDSAVLPAGEYSITINSMWTPTRAFLRTTDGKMTALVVTSITGDAAKGPSALFITGEGNQSRVRSLNLPQLGRTLVYKPLTAREREVLYETNSAIRTGRRGKEVVLEHFRSQFA